MENASKALIIAGAILLSILLITLGIMVYRQASGVVDSTSMDETAVSTFNQKFQQYEGENIRGAQVNSLISTVIQNNLSNANDDSKQVAITVSNGVSWAGVSALSSLKVTSTSNSGRALTAKSYKVTCAADPKSGYITNITIANA